MTLHFDLLIANRQPRQRAQTPVFAPYDRSEIATLEQADREDIEQALQMAYEAYCDHDKWLGKDQRISILQKAAAILESQLDDLAMEAAREGGKPLVDSKIELLRAVDGLHSCVECLRNDAGKEIPMGINAASQGHLAFTRKEPIGVVVAFSAFNHPMNLIVHQIGPAIAAGCPVIVKPAEDTPLSCYRLVDIFRQAGLPDVWCQALLTENHAVSAHLVSDHRVAFFSFIGSAKVGWMLRSKLAPGTRCALEHGGAAPVIINSDADINDALPLLAKGGFYHAGQVCVSVQRVFCHHSLAREVAEELAMLGNALSVGDPLDSTTEVGPLIRPAETDRIHQWVSQAVAEGAELLSGGEKLSATCYQPTVLFNPRDDSLVSSAEIFGPVICVYSFDDLDDAIERANRVPFSFQAAVFTKHLDTALRAYTRLNASAVMLNQHTAFRVDWMPFAGLKESGLGVGGIPYTFADMQIDKMLVIRSPEL